MLAAARLKVRARMQIKYQEIAGHVTGTLKPVYLIVGDEPLLVEETCDAIIKAARDQNYTERSVHHVETGFRWSEIIHDSASISLFAERKILDVRLGNKKIDRDGSEVVREWLAQADGETLLLLRGGRLDANQRKSAWFKAIDEIGIISLIWDIEARELPRWLQQRMAIHKLKAEDDALSYLAQRVEGNLLAAQQEIQKLSLLGLEMPISLEVMARTLEDVSRFTVFDLANAMMMSEVPRVRHILQSLKDDGTAPMAVLAPFVSQLRRMGNTRGLPQQTVKAMSAFSRRIPDVSPVLAECAVIDQQIKGQLAGDGWRSLEKLFLRLAGLRKISLPSQDLGSPA